MYGTRNFVARFFASVVLPVPGQPVTTMRLGNWLESFVNGGMSGNQQMKKKKNKRRPLFQPDAVEVHRRAGLDVHHAVDRAREVVALVLVAVAHEHPSRLGAQVSNVCQ